jgi:crotonobetainyl-CoA:carnitine CoA-transferase CaiB-like acyl-CoA transferase
MSEPRPGPLAGVRVLDLTRVIVGPYCSQFLGDMGAEVIKVESPEGDLTRSVGPQRNPNMSANFLIFNRNKRSIVLDLKSPRGHEALMRLAASCDAFVVNYRPAALAKLKISYEDLKAANPSIVYCRIVGYGEDNPYASKPAIDDVVQSLSGVVDLQERLNGQPSYVGLPLADLTCGLFALGGMLGALYRKATTGLGDEVEVRMYDAMASFVLSPHLSGNSFEPPLSPPIYPRSVSPNRRPFRTSDGSIAVAPYTDRAWRSFLSLVDRADMLDDPRYSTPYVRAQHLDELYQMMIPLIAARTSAEWLTLLEQADVPCSPVLSTVDLVSDPALHRAGLLAQYDHPTEGEIRLLSNPVRFTEAPSAVHRLPPNLGADSREVLAEIGYDDATIDDMIRDGVTAVATVGAAAQ